MADTKHLHAGSDPVEGDGVSYRGIVWFVVVLAVTTLFSQGLMVVTLKWMQSTAVAQDAPRAPLAPPAGQLPPPPNLLTDERGNLQRFRESEDETLTSYAWINQATGAVQIPIERAKALLLQRGLPARDANAPAAPAKPASKKHP